MVLKMLNKRSVGTEGNRPKQVKSLSINGSTSETSPRMRLAVKDNELNRIKFDTLN
jgi:hypothetical protein